ncbi:hypothetical protein GALL_514350 [mine drainage metagenome]|uniref:Periplasmic heavy metal sensor n=1 Tax=mine drainage metagenome TaxID=410659 RepID=A0A1J5PTV7_9ZZZZ
MTNTALPPTPATKPVSRLMRIVLVISLGLNLAIIGTIGGFAVSHALHDGPHGGARELGFGPFSAALSPADRKAMFDSFRSQNINFLAQRQAMRADFDTLLAALKANPYDSAAVEAVMARQQARTDERLALGQKLLMERIAAMSPADRAAFADRLQAAIAQHEHRGDAKPDASAPKN